MRRLLGVLFVLSLIWAAPVMAGTQTITRVASYGQPLEVAFTTQVVGTVTVNVTWQPKPRVIYTLRVVHLTDPSDIYSYDLSCNADQPRGNLTCEIPDGPAGYWRARFLPEGGKVEATMTITTP